MALEVRYQDQVRRLMRVLPIVAEEDVFALKGGTAINLFARDMPRLSVDIDLAYMSTEPRQQALPNVREAFDCCIPATLCDAKLPLDAQELDRSVFDGSLAYLLGYPALLKEC